jgi:hypothetical protein
MQKGRGKGIPTTYGKLQETSITGIGINLKQYQQYVRPHFGVLITVWVPWHSGDKVALEKVRRNATANSRPGRGNL